VYLSETYGPQSKGVQDIPARLAQLLTIQMETTGTFHEFLIDFEQYATDCAITDQLKLGILQFDKNKYTNLPIQLLPDRLMTDVEETVKRSMDYNAFKAYLIERDGLQHERGIVTEKRTIMRTQIKNSSSEVKTEINWRDLCQEAKDARLHCMNCFNDRLHEAKHCQLNACYYCKAFNHRSIDCRFKNNKKAESDNNKNNNRRENNNKNNNSSNNQNIDDSYNNNNNYNDKTNKKDKDNKNKNLDKQDNYKNNKKRSYNNSKNGKGIRALKSGSDSEHYYESDDSEIHSSDDDDEESVKAPKKINKVKFEVNKIRIIKRQIRKTNKIYDNNIITFNKPRSNLKKLLKFDSGADDHVVKSIDQLIVVKKEYTSENPSKDKL
jgi:hypothetical protein